MKEVIGAFTVTDGTLRQQTVIISQETVLDSNGTIIKTIKHLNLNSVDGEEVHRLEGENTLTLNDGTMLRKTGNVRLGDPELDMPRIRRSRQR